MKCSLAHLALLVLLATPALAQAISPEELAFWQSVSATNDPAELRAYLNAYPNGAFTALAIDRLQQAAPPGQAQLSPVRPPPTSVPASLARLAPTRPSFRLVDGVTLDLDATGVRNASNLRLTVVPAGTQVAVADPDRLVLESTPVPAKRLRLTIPSGSPGADEVRLYYIPNTGSTYLLAASAPVIIEAGVPGATLVSALGREAAQIGPIRFEANHRGRPMLIQGAFLSMKPSTEWNAQWFAGQAVEQLNRQVLIMSVGPAERDRGSIRLDGRGGLRDRRVGRGHVGFCFRTQDRGPRPGFSNANLLGQRQARRSCGA